VAPGIWLNGKCQNVSLVAIPICDYAKGKKESQPKRQKVSLLG